jgi:hypothetical protein
MIWRKYRLGPSIDVEVARSSAMDASHPLLPALPHVRGRLEGSCTQGARGDLQSVALFRHFIESWRCRERRTWNVTRSGVRADQASGPLATEFV